MSGRWADRDLAALIGTALRAGVLLAAAVAAIGGLIYLARYGATVADYRVFSGEPQNLRSVGGIVAAAAHGRSRGLIQLGLLLLVATPIARVALSLLGFARERDWRYVGITALVLGILLFSVLGGGA